MDLSSIFTALYPLVPVIGIAAYFPQIISLLKNKTCIESFTLSMWWTWAFASVLGFGYSWFALNDVLTSVTCFLHLAVQLFVIGCVMSKRLTLKAQQLQSISLQNQSAGRL